MSSLLDKHRRARVRNAGLVTIVALALVACTPNDERSPTTSATVATTSVSESASATPPPRPTPTPTATATVTSQPDYGIWIPRPRYRDPKAPPPPKLEPDPSPGGATMSKPLFHCGYANFAWSRVARGAVLDDKGRVWTYDLGKTWTPTPAAGGLYAGSGLRERFQKLVLQTARVPPDKLDEMSEKALRAPDGRIEKRAAGADAGGRGCEAYLWERPDAYREIELGSDGNMQVRNTSPEADAIWVWLEMDLGMSTP